jgi:hypothetical protein
MQSLIFIGSYCVLSIVVAFVIQRYIRGFVRRMLLSPTISATILQIVAYFYLGYVDGWADIAFVTTWLIALGCTLAVNLLGWLWSRLHNEQ